MEDLLDLFNLLPVDSAIEHSDVPIIHTVFDAQLFLTISNGSFASINGFLPMANEHLMVQVCTLSTNIVLEAHVPAFPLEI